MLQTLRATLAWAIPPFFNHCGNWMAANVIFHHVPWMNGEEQRNWMSWQEYLDAAAMLGRTALSAAIAFPHVEGWMGISFGNAHDGPLTFLVRFFISCVVRDACFYMAHRWFLHSKIPELYAFHKQHHLHTVTNVGTTSYISVVDFLTEGLANYALAMLVLANLPFPVPFADWIVGAHPDVFFAIEGYNAWYHFANHSGKHVPTCDFFPFLPPLSKLIWGSSAALVEYHDDHHRVINGNYGETPMFDKMMGTYNRTRWELHTTYTDTHAHPLPRAG